jgi:hypothetical protein
MIQTKRINRRRTSMSRSRVRFALGVLFVAFALEPSVIADVWLQPGAVTTVTDGKTTKTSSILINGKITEKDEKGLAVALARLKTEGPGLVLLALNSSGGELLPAMRMGRVLRSALAQTLVVRGGTCSSACVFLLASGIDRRLESDSRVGLHRPTFPQEILADMETGDVRRTYDKLTADCQKYLKDMGMDDKLFADMLRVPSQEIRFVDANYCDSVGLTGTDPGYDEMGRARAIKRWGRDFVDRRDAALKCIKDGIEQSDCLKRFGITELNPK